MEKYIKGGVINEYNLKLVQNFQNFNVQFQFQNIPKKLLGNFKSIKKCALVHWCIGAF